VLVENDEGLAPLCDCCLSAYEFGVKAGQPGPWLEIRREALR
jgi:hypothetical protein